MPAPARTGREQLVAAARDLLEEGGVDAVTMAAVADRVGVRSPSLYKHVRDRGGLLGLVVAATVEDVTARLDALRDPDPGRSVLAQVEGMRGFAHERPHGFRLMFGVVPGVPSPDPSAAEASLRPLLDAMTALVGPEHALDGARLVTAWANGFITMELTGALRLGGDLDAAWAWGLRRIVAAVTAG
ncbi:TetR/AcrR family transcriptional regulator [uncultured Amnibacterium sp.]|uniref:TetR/AcrR family transcriptional regulator n=1 Tax=uncultured Amnibacterium sp. TaxID=1631851 RepID=UPI0035CA86A5